MRIQGLGPEWTKGGTGGGSGGMCLQRKSGEMTRCGQLGESLLHGLLSGLW